MIATDNPFHSAHDMFSLTKFLLKRINSLFIYLFIYLSLAKYRTRDPDHESRMFRWSRPLGYDPRMSKFEICFDIFQILLNVKKIYGQSLVKTMNIP